MISLALIPTLTTCRPTVHLYSLFHAMFISRRAGHSTTLHSPSRRITYVLILQTQGKSEKVGDSHHTNIQVSISSDMTQNQTFLVEIKFRPLWPYSRKQPSWEVRAEYHVRASLVHTTFTSWLLKIGIQRSCVARAPLKQDTAKLWRCLCRSGILFTVFDGMGIKFVARLAAGAIVWLGHRMIGVDVHHECRSRSCFSTWSDWLTHSPLVRPSCQSREPAPQSYIPSFKNSLPLRRDGSMDGQTLSESWCLPEYVAKA